MRESPISSLHVTYDRTTSILSIAVGCLRPNTTFNLNFCEPPNLVPIYIIIITRLRQKEGLVFWVYVCAYVQLFFPLYNLNGLLGFDTEKKKEFLLFRGFYICGYKNIQNSEG